MYIVLLLFYFRSCFLFLLFLLHLLFNKKKLKKIIIKPKTLKQNFGALVLCCLHVLLWGYPLFLCIEDNAHFCCGGRCTLVESNYALVTCSVYGQFFKIIALSNIMLDLQCTYLHDFIHTPHHLIACTP